MNTKYIHHIHPHSLFPHTYLLHWYPLLKLLSCKFRLGTSGLYISCFYQINPPLVALCLLPFSHNIQQLTVQYIRLYSYVHESFQYFSFSNSFFLPRPVDRLTNTILFSLSPCIYALCTF
jgi:hypothetical protein